MSSGRHPPTGEHATLLQSSSAGAAWAIGCQEIAAATPKMPVNTKIITCTKPHRGKPQTIGSSAFGARYQGTLKIMANSMRASNGLLGSPTLATMERMPSGVSCPDRISRVAFCPCCSEASAVAAEALVELDVRDAPIPEAFMTSIATANCTRPTTAKFTKTEALTSGTGARRFLSPAATSATNDKRPAKRPPVTACSETLL
mmetsp:Transcript_112503/g.314376  ORF Transcript_112503/g.314376 Transcript_112503/m.314376 type:complete len:202 (-) Transcript_112503:995-1600(-)